MSWSKPFAVSVVSTMLALLVTELALRAAYPTLPSLSGLIGQSGWQEGDAIQRCDARALMQLKPTAPVPGGRRLLVTGDSVALGFGLPSEKRLGALIAARLTESGERWSEVNSALAGGTACVTLNLAQRALERAEVDVGVVVLFADDLMEAPRFWVNGHRVAFPETIHRPSLRWLALNSYAANTVWWGAGATLLNRPQSLASDRVTVDTLRQSIVDLKEIGARRNTPLVLTLLPPAGISLCGAGQTEPEVCELGEEMQHIASYLDEWWPGWVDLRGVFDGGDYRLPIEVEDNRLDIHPSEAGHARIADALLPAVDAALATRPRSARPGPLRPAVPADAEAGRGYR